MKKNKKRFCVGDIHGELHKLEEVLKLCNFDFENDQLISLGDIVDRGKDSFGCVELLKTIKNSIFIKGNHDEEWFRSLQSGQNSSLHSQGGKETLISYLERKISPEVHFEFFANQVNYYIDENKNLFVHGGFNRHYLLSEHSDNLLFLWDRDLFMSALSYKGMKNNIHPFKIKEPLNEIFIGHTPTTYWGSTTPINAANIWNIDTGSGKGGVLTIMDIETKQFWQSQ